MLIDGSRVFEGVDDGGLGDFVEDDALGGPDVQAQGVGEMPGDGFAFAVQVGGEEDFGGSFHGGAKIGNDFFGAVRDFVGGFEVVIDVDIESLAGDVADVADGGFDGEVVAQVLIDGLGLGGGFDDDQSVAGAAAGGRGGRVGRGFANGFGHEEKVLPVEVTSI